MAPVPLVHQPARLSLAAVKESESDGKPEAFRTSDGEARVSFSSNQDYISARFMPKANFHASPSLT